MCFDYMYEVICFDILGTSFDTYFDQTYVIIYFDIHFLNMCFDHMNVIIYFDILGTNVDIDFDNMYMHVCIYLVVHGDTCKGSTPLLELTLGLLTLCRRTLGSERHRHSIA